MSIRYQWSKINLALDCYYSSSIKYDPRSHTIQDHTDFITFDLYNPDFVTFYGQGFVTFDSTISTSNQLPLSLLFNHLHLHPLQQQWS